VWAFGVNQETGKRRACVPATGANAFDKMSAWTLYVAQLKKPLPGEPRPGGAGCRPRGSGGGCGRGNGIGGMEYFLCVLGMVLIVEGLPYFAFPARMKEWLARIGATPDGHLRKLGLALMALGLWLVYAGRS